MTRFVTYDPEVAARLSQAVGVHRVELRDAAERPKALNPALMDAIHPSQRSAVLMPSSDEQVLVVQVNGTGDSGFQGTKKRHKKKAKQQERDLQEIGSQPGGFLGLQDEAVYSDNTDEQEDPPRSLWKKDE